MMNQPNFLTPPGPKRYLPWLWFLTSIFSLRILGQMLQALFGFEIFSSASIWMGSSIPYPTLLFTQTTMLMGMLLTNVLIHQEKFSLSEKRSHLLKWTAFFYLGSMLLRLLLGSTLLKEHAWFDKPIPTLTHIFLSQYLLTLACCSVKKQKLITETRAYFVYPTTFIICLSYFWVLVQSTELPYFLIVNTLVGLTTLSIFFLEIAEPYRNTWVPKYKELASDVSTLIMIQIILPKMIAYGAAMYMLSNVQLEIFADTIDYKALPIWLQVIVMILTADFFRYWFHRWSHTCKPLWTLHKIHHTPNKLYTVNVGRFHVADKSFHVLIDTVPFILLGVSELALSLYFLCYAINGVFQHSNLPLRYGLLNYLISTSEMHRWHHSVSMREAQSNFGNTTIIWDILFGSYYNPNQAEVKKVGISNPLQKVI